MGLISQIRASKILMQVNFYESPFSDFTIHHSPFNHPERGVPSRHLPAQS